MSVPSVAQDTWTETAVPLASIEDELEKLWHRAASGAPKSADVPLVARARVANFVAYAPSNAAARQVIEMVDHVATRHPSRTIIVIAHEEDTTPALNATIIARAQTDADGRRLLHERVQIDARGPVTESLPSIVVPLLIPDLPTYLWWPGDPPVDHTFWRRMVDACDRLIVNSADFTSPFDSIARFAEFYRGARRFHTFGDLNWTGLTQWRELIAQFFDNQAYRPFLDGIEKVTIEYSGMPGEGLDTGARSSCALLLAGWLCARLGWESTGCEAAPGGRLRYSLTGWPSGRQLTLHLQALPRTAKAIAAVESVRLAATSQERRAVFTIIREERSGDAQAVAHVAVETEGMAGPARTVNMQRVDLPMGLAKELEFSGHDETYEAALAVSGRLALQSRATKR